jgi:16S rRNA (uracil1498-N3)-methyltransferase
MNSLIILADECVGDKQAILTGDRARYAYETHELRQGACCRVALLGGLRGDGIVEEATRDRVVMAITLTLAPLERVPIDLIVGVPRPQTVKKVIQAAVMLGVRSLHFVKSELGEKSYLQSRALSEEGILEEGAKALEQIWDSRLPTIEVHRNFSYFMRNKLPPLTQEEGVACLLADPTGRELTTADKPLVRLAQVVAIGPERGWSEGEVKIFKYSGFSVVGLGERVVRVEVALVFLIGQLRLVQEPYEKPTDKSQ